MRKDITIYDIANQLQLSTATVSRALAADPVVKKKTRQLVLETANKMGYRSNYHARSLRKSRTNSIGFMVHELQSTFINSVLAGVEKITTDAGYDLIIAHSLESYEAEVANARNLFHKRIDGLITSLSCETKNLDHFQPYKDKGVPVIFFDRVDTALDSTAVIIDNYKAAYEATTHLIDQGCSRIVHLTANLTRNVYSERLRGYRDALHNNGIPLDEGLVIINSLTEEAAVASAKRILCMNPLPDGAFITNDFVAAVCMRTFKEYKLRIPRDIAIVGFNNDAISTVTEPALTTINYPGEEIGMTAARRLISHLEGAGSIHQIQTIVLNSRLIVRGSSQKKAPNA
ncbi:MAG: LacI family DNA-binding transcriptional regulator [Bacteroidetes bacterium]|nr:LacI family DNA-binding transcriptional regulator [Bacteroidota bacterium]